MKAARTPARKPLPDPSEVSAALLEALGRAGPDGVKPAGLRLSGKTPLAAARRDALASLVADRRAALLGTGAAARYFLAENVPTAATVAARLLALGAFGAGVLDTPPALWKEMEFRRKLPVHERPLLGDALAHLQEKRQIVPLRQGKHTFLAFAGPLRVWLEEDAADAPAVGPAPDSVPDEADGDLDAALFLAYTRLVRESGGFPDVKIAGLRRVAGDPASLGERLVALWRDGRATLSLGDWSLADEATRAAAVELDGEKYLLVRLDG